MKGPDAASGAAMRAMATVSHSVWGLADILTFLCWASDEVSYPGRRHVRGARWRARWLAAFLALPARPATLVTEKLGDGLIAPRMTERGDAVRFENRQAGESEES